MEFSFPNSYLVIDTETTGLDPKKDKIVEIAVIKVKDGKIIDRWSSFLDWGVPIPAEATAIHGITDEMVKGNDPLNVLSRFFSLVVWEIVGEFGVTWGREDSKALWAYVTHNGLRFDVHFIKKALLDVGFEESRVDILWKKFHHDHVDTAAIFKVQQMQEQNHPEAKRHWLESPGNYQKKILDIKAPIKFNLGVACDYFKIDRSNVTQHRALGDCELTYLLYQKMCL